MTTAIMASDPMIALAQHELEVDNLSADMDAQDLRTARNQEQAALKQQIEKLHEAADDMRRGAIVQGAFSLAGAGCGMGGDLMNKGLGATLLKGAGTAFSSLAAPMGRWTGDVPQKNDEADAKLAEAHVADARSRAEEADHHRQRTEQASDRTLSALDNILSSEAQGNLAVIANV